MNALIEERTRFLSRFPARLETVGGRRWETIDVNPNPDGGRPTLVMLPGTLGRADIFWRIAERLAGRSRLLAVTYPASFDLKAWAEDVLRLLDRRQLDSVHVIGSSLGGYLAQWLASVHSDRVAGLIAANTLHAVDFVRAVPPYAGDLERTPIATLRSGFGAGLGRWAETNPDQTDLVELLMADVHGRIPARHLRARLLALKLAPALPSPKPAAWPVAVIESADDPLITEPIRDAVRNRLNPAVTYRFSWGGHFPYVVRPDLYAAAVAECLGVESTDGSMCQTTAGVGWSSGSIRRC